MSMNMNTYGAIYSVFVIVMVCSFVAWFMLRNSDKDWAIKIAVVLSIGSLLAVAVMAIMSQYNIISLS